MKLNIPQIDADLASEGKWFPFNDEVSFKIAQYGNPVHKRAVQAKFKHLQKLQERGEIERIERANNEILARCIVKGWRGLVEDGGRELEFTFDNALSIIADPTYRGIKDFITECSQMAGEFDTQDDEEEIVKN